VGEGGERERAREGRIQADGRGTERKGIGLGGQRREGRGREQRPSHARG